ncbi:endonuclease/exonuclease/phosphatase family protein [Streptomyces sp. NPDC001876]|uniref:endonuclease/exonuclease/phosphatase family protein n=1 Tax=Streptomyces sp. NPDC001876 TaxID=3154402 RepID=UPI00331A97B5
MRPPRAWPQRGEGDRNLSIEVVHTGQGERSAHVVVAGDLNDTPGSPPLAFLEATSLKDAMTHGSYEGPPGTHGKCTNLNDKIDYLMFSPELFAKVDTVEVERRGIFESGTPFDTVNGPDDQASDHAAIVAELDL